MIAAQRVSLREGSTRIRSPSAIPVHDFIGRPHSWSGFCSNDNHMSCTAPERSQCRYSAAVVAAGRNFGASACATGIRRGTARVRLCRPEGERTSPLRSRQGQPGGGAQSAAGSGRASWLASGFSPRSSGPLIRPGRPARDKRRPDGRRAGNVESSLAQPASAGVGAAEPRAADAASAGGTDVVGEQGQLHRGGCRE
jgi:hypothetical protein